MRARIGVCFAAILFAACSTPPPGCVETSTGKTVCIQMDDAGCLAGTTDVSTPDGGAACCLIGNAVGPDGDGGWACYFDGGAVGEDVGPCPGAAVCGGGCMPIGAVCCSETASTYCNAGEVCTGGGCCPSGETACGSACIASGDECCVPATAGYCAAGQTCYNATAFDAGWRCENSGAPCPAGEAACGSGCILAGGSCCDPRTGTYCLPGSTCSIDAGTWECQL